MLSSDSGTNGYRPCEEHTQALEVQSVSVLVEQKERKHVCEETINVLPAQESSW